MLAAQVLPPYARASQDRSTITGAWHAPKGQAVTAIPFPTRSSQAPPGPAFSVEVDSDRHLIRVSGELDHATAPVLVAAAHSLAEDPSDLVVDLGGLTFLDSAGLNTLVELGVAAHDRGCNLRLRNVTGHVRRVVTLGGLTSLL
jgi:anti-sigma B factor antagonist